MSETKGALADSIRKISSALEDLTDSGLNEKAIIILVQHKTKISQRVIREVIQGLRDLKKEYCS